jgi:hypothetical protein
MSLEITGTVIDILSTQTFNKGFKKREFVIETSEKYSQKVVLQLVQDKCDMIDSYGIGDTVTASFNVKGRDWVDNSGNVKYFNTLEVWKIVGKGRGSYNEESANSSGLDEDDDEFFKDLGITSDQVKKSSTKKESDPFFEDDEDFPF